MNRLIAAAGLSFLICFVLGPVLIPILRRLKFGQNIRTDGPQSHFKKSGTPTMGGIMILAAITISYWTFSDKSITTYLVLLLTLGYGLLGFIDDFIKTVKKRSLGLRANQKIFGQIVLALALVFLSMTYSGINTEVFFPFLNKTIDLGWLYLPFVLVVTLGGSNAVNLTDGLDGLASGITALVALGYAIILLSLGHVELAIFCSTISGACLAFIWYNSNPAQVFMGDTGSLALGGALALVAILSKTEFLLVILGGVYVIEALSVIIQVISFRFTGKRVFKMSPIHHHFELSGWPEQKVVMRFYIITIVFIIIGLISWPIRP
ncbi:MAG TPA: phospho-N-acetylmuramoyl-pentapeptide-transferase [Clostridia bacterium]|jgi:phospho-N-acetylmuramoyl-pentapeptide-transferase|nr:phospho-N-acetylmuramoyl-pentapeptide-transferase [Clostridia bacterium]